MVIFIFISGYLKKDRGSDKENWKKYWYGLIIPYIIYNVVVYPYWILKYYLTNGAMPDLFHAMRPLIGALLLEHESSFAEPLNGPLWYLPAILIMHIIIDLCRKTKYQHWIMAGLCILSVFLYGANKYYEFAPYLYLIIIWDTCLGNITCSEIAISNGIVLAASHAYLQVFCSSPGIWRHSMQGNISCISPSSTLSIYYSSLVCYTAARFSIVSYGDSSPIFPSELWLSLAFISCWSRLSISPSRRL